MLPFEPENRFQLLTVVEGEWLVRLRLLVARAAQPDSLQWWEDRSLTLEGGYVTERLFGGRPRLAAARIAMATARARHWAMLEKTSSVVHLFDFGDDVEYEIEAVPLDESMVPVEPQDSVEALVLAVGQVIPEGIGYSATYSGRSEDQRGPFEIQLAPERELTVKLVLAQASALALAYGAAGPKRPVFPYLKR